MALVEAGVDVHCTENDGYGPSHCILVSMGCDSTGADGPSTRVWSCRSGCFGCAGGRRCTMRRRTATRRRRWRWSSWARTCTARATTGAVPRAASSCRRFDDSAGADGPSTRVWSCRSGCFRLCRRTALHAASQNGHMETLLVLVKAGADVRCKDDDGYASRGCLLMSLVCSRSRGGRSVDSGVELQESLLSAVQGDGAALCVIKRPPGNGAGAGQGGRGRALQGQGRVRFLEAAPLCCLLPNI